MDENIELFGVDFESFMIEQEKPKSQMYIGNIHVANTQHFNWLQRKMWKFLLNIEIENLKESN